MVLLFVHFGLDTAHCMESLVGVFFFPSGWVCGVEHAVPACQSVHVSFYGKAVICLANHHERIMIYSIFEYN